MDLIFDPNQLGADASDTAFSPDAAFENVVHSQFAPDLSDRLIGVRKFPVFFPVSREFPRRRVSLGLLPLPLPDFLRISYIASLRDPTLCSISQLLSC